ncbi:MAG: hypothetical protein ACI39U_07605, partial [Candidatus Cryptobacteroides sp.]
MKKIAILIVALLPLAGCVRELAEEQKPMGGGLLVRKTVRASIGDLSKIQLSPDEEKGVFHSLWSADDSIALIDGSGTLVRATLQSGAGTSEGTFEYEAEESFEPAYAAYPYAEDIRLQGTSLLLSLPCTQKVGSGPDPAACLMASRITGGSFVLKPVCSILKLVLSGNTGKVRRVFLSPAYSNPLAGSGMVDMSTDEPSFVVTSAKSEERFITIIPENPFDLSAAGDKAVFVAVPSGKFQGLSVEILGSQSASDEDEDIALSSSASHDFRTGHILPLNCSLECPQETVDLSCNGGWANCYLLDNADAAAYRFDARTPNGSVLDGSTPIDDVTSMSVDIPFNAQLLWQDAPIVKKILYDKIRGRVYFTTNGSVKGNALIGVRKRNGTLCWSWHIWANGEPLSEYGGFADRNLGAVSCGKGDELSRGLFYQWGRKDPFCSSEQEWETRESTSQTKGTADYARKNPTHILYAGTNYNGSAESYGDWLWGTHLDNLWSDTKTNYDPCPYGWQVPSPSALAGLASLTVEKDNINKGTAFISDSYSLWFPWSGSRKRTDGTAVNVGTTAYYWSSGVSSKGASDLVLSNGTTSSGTLGRAQSVSVRCVKTSSGSVTPAEGATIYGIVTASGEPVEGVVVSDGVLTT